MYNNDPKYMNPQQGIASLAASPYADSDVMNVKMTPREVAGLQQLAMSYGAREEDLYDPITGQPKFSFLKKILPMIAGAILPGIPGLGTVAKTIGFGNQALGSALLVGGVTGLVEGDLKKGLMAGLGAYSGAKIGEGFMAAGRPPPAAEAVAPPPSTLAQQLGLKESELISPSGFDTKGTLGVNIPDTSGPIPAVPPTRAADIVQTVTPRQEPTGFFGTMGQGVKNVFSSGEAGAAGRQAFVGAFDNPISRYATMFGVANALTPEQKPLEVPEQENIMYIPGGFNPQYGTGANQPYMLPGKYYKKTSKGLVPYNPYQMAKGYADGGEVGVAAGQGPDGRDQIDYVTNQTKGILPDDPNVAANRAYVEELNRRALNPVHNPYGMIVAGSGGLGGTNTPYTGTNPYGGPLNTTTGGGQQTGGGGGAGDIATSLLASYGMQEGVKALLPYAGKALGAFGIGPGALTGVTATGLVPGTAAYNAAMAAKAGTAAAGAGTGAATGATGAAGAGTGAATTGTGAAGAGTSGAGGASALKGGASAAGTAAAAAAALYGAHQAYEGIRKGKEGQAAAGGALAGAGGAYLAGASGLGGAGLTSLAGFGPVGLAAAAIAAIGASLVNTKEQGDVALRNYWKAVDQGRGLASAPPQELAEGFINFYRTNKNNFAGQEKYGRKGNEDFVYDMTQVINNAVNDGKVSKDAKPEEIYQKVVQPWLNSMGSGPKDADARRIQDFMLTDMIYNFMLGRPISNAQVKNDKNFKIVSQKPVYAGNPPPLLAQLEEAKAKAMGGQGVDGQKLAEYLRAQNPYGATMPFAEGGSVGEDYNFGFAMGGMPEYKAGGKLLDGPGDGMSDSIPAVIRGKGEQRAALADGEFVVPADVVSHLGNGSTKAGAKKLYAMMDRVRQARTGKTRQAPAVKADKYLPA